MANWERALRDLKKMVSQSTTTGNIRKHDLYSGLADRIIDKHQEKMNKRWKVEWAKEIMKDKKCN